MLRRKTMFLCFACIVSLLFFFFFASSTMSCDGFKVLLNSANCFIQILYMNYIPRLTKKKEVKLRWRVRKKIVLNNLYLIVCFQFYILRCAMLNKRKLEQSINWKLIIKKHFFFLLRPEPNFSFFVN